MRVVVPFARLGVRDDLDPAVCNAARSQETIRNALQLVASAPHDDDLEAAVLVEVNVERRSYALAQLVLKLGQLLGQLADVVIVNEREGGDGGSTPGYLRADDLGSNEVAQ